MITMTETKKNVLFSKFSHFHAINIFLNMSYAYARTGEREEQQKN